MSQFEVKDGLFIDPSLVGIVFEKSAFDEMRSIVDRVVVSERNWGLFTTTSYTREEAIAKLGDIIRGYEKCVHETSCFSQTPVISLNFVKDLEEKLETHNSNGSFRYWDIEDMGEQEMPTTCNGWYDDTYDTTSGKLRKDCHFLTEENAHDAYVCSYDESLKLLKPSPPIRIDHLMGSQPPYRWPSRCELLNSKKESLPTNFWENRWPRFGGSGGGVM